MRTRSLALLLTPMVAAPLAAQPGGGGGNAFPTSDPVIRQMWSERMERSQTLLLMQALTWEYGTYTWHTNRDTFDKVVFDDLKMNATMTAMLVYMASEDPDPMPRERRVMPTNQQGTQQQWPTCGTPTRATP